MANVLSAKSLIDGYRFSAFEIVLSNGKQRSCGS